jgi:hypothetical protein
VTTRAGFLVRLPVLAHLALTGCAASPEKPVVTGAIDTARVIAQLECPAPKLAQASAANVAPVASPLDKAQGTPCGGSAARLPHHSRPATDRAVAIATALSHAAARGPTLSRSSSSKPMYFRYPEAATELSRSDAVAVEALVRDLGRDDRVSISFGRGGSGNAFEQLVIGYNRAERINQLLPADQVVSVEFDPMLPDDTSRLEVVPAER